MSNETIISSSEITYVLVIQGFIGCSRALEPSLCDNIMVGVELLCWLDEAIPSFSSIKEYSRLDDMYGNLAGSITAYRSRNTNSGESSPSSSSSSNKMAVVEYAFDTLRGLQRNNSVGYNSVVPFSLDSLLELVETSRGLFQEDASTGNVNGCPGPTKVCADSLLGIFLRSFSAKFDSLSFESIGRIYERLMVFTRSRSIMGSSGGYIVKPEEAKMALSKVEGVGDNPSFVALRGRITPDPSPVLYLLNSMKAISQGDVTAAERELHKYFDFNSTDLIKSNLSQGPPSAVGSDGKNNVVELSVAEAVLQLRAANNHPLFAGHRHQQAMLSLARLWTENRQFGLALSSVEEAMKISHNRGDHQSVARALLLIHEVAVECRRHYLPPASTPDALISGSRIDINMEEVLLRCIDRCVEMGASQLVAQATVRLAKLYSEAPLSQSSAASLSGLKLLSDKSTCGNDVISAVVPARAMPGNGQEADAKSASTIWTLLACAQIGECHLISQIVHNGHILDPIGIPSASPMGLLPGRDTNNASSADSPLSAADSLQLIIQASVVAIDFWKRLNVPSMAMLQCRRALCLFTASGVASSHETVYIVCSFAKILVTSEVDRYLLMAGPSDSSEVRGGYYATIISVCDRSLRVLKRLDKIYKSKFPQNLRTQIDSAILYIKTYKNMYSDGQTASAIGMTLKLLEMNYPLAFSRYNSSASALSSGDVSYLLNMCTSPDAVDIWFLYASVLEKVNPLESLAVLRCLHSSLAERGFVESSLHAAVLCEQCIIVNDIQVEMNRSLVHLRDIYFLSSKYCYHLIEYVAARCIYQLVGNDIRKRSI